MSAPPKKPWETAAATPAAGSSGGVRSTTIANPTATSTPSNVAAASVNPTQSTPEGVMNTQQPLNNNAYNTATDPNSTALSPYNRYGMTSSYPQSSAYSSPYSSYNSPYGGSAYGSSPYGMGSSMYGSQYGMGAGGLNPMLNGAMNPMMAANGFFGKLTNTPMTLMHGFENSVQAFGRLSQLLHMNFEALHMSFGSVVRLLEGWFILKHELLGTMPTMSLMNVVGRMYATMRKLVAKLLGQKLPVDFDEYWQLNQQSVGQPPLLGPDGRPLPPHMQPHASQQFAAGQQQPGQGSAWSWIPIVLSIYFGWNVLKFLWGKLKARLFPPNPAEEFLKQQQMLAQQVQQQQAAQQQQQQQQQQNTTAAANANTTNVPANMNTDGTFNPMGSTLPGATTAMGMQQPGMMGGMYSSSPMSSMYNSSNPYSTYSSPYGTSGMYGAGAGGYGSSMYGNSGYSSMYGNGGMYGSGSMYGGAGSMYGGGYGGSSMYGQGGYGAGGYGGY